MKNKFLIVFFVIITISIIVLTTLSISFNAVLNLSEAQKLYIFSASSQVIAGLYGLVLTGYVILNSALNNAVKKDDTLHFIVTTIKNNSFYSIVYISVITVVTVFLCIFNMLLSNQNQPYSGYLLNLAMTFITINLIMIVSFACTLIDPKKVERVSLKLKINLENQEQVNYYNDIDLDDNMHIEGDLAQYNDDLDIIIRTITTYFFKEYSESESMKRSKSTNYSIHEMIKRLFTESKISNEDKEHLITMITYRNVVGHSNQTQVSKAMNISMKKLKEKILSELK